MKQQAENAEKNQPAAADVKTAEAKSAATSTVITTILDIAANTARSPLHAPSLADAQRQSARERRLHDADELLGVRETFV